MAKSKIMFIGDFREKNTLLLLDSFVDKYIDHYDIMVTGYNQDQVRINTGKRGEIIICDMKSQESTYYKNAAEHVIVCTSAARYRKEKKNQHVIYVLSDFEAESFAGLIGDIDTLITDNSDLVDLFHRTFPSVECVQYSTDGSGTKEDGIIRAIAIEPRPAYDSESFLVVSTTDSDKALKDPYGVGSILKQHIKSQNATVIALTPNGKTIGATSNIRFDQPEKVRPVLSEFDGIVLFADDNSRMLFDSFVKENKIQPKYESSYLFSEMQLKLLEKEVSKHETVAFDKAASDYSKYRYLMRKLYEINHCEDRKVSIIICRYNTPFDLIERAIVSALNSGHDNVEVIVVDDGSSDNIENDLMSRFHDDRLAYYYKENEGPGLSRNYGIRKASGDYLFYLDSDDTIHEDGLPCLVSHAEFFGIDLVIGKRVLCDEKGVPTNESLSELAGDIFLCYYNDHGSSDVYRDVMVNNLLIRRQKLIELDMWFNKGVYEDVEYTAQLYSRMDEYHYLNVIIHDWYQYGANTTLSSSVNMKNFLERLEKENSAWSHLPEERKCDCLISVLVLSFNRYLRSYSSFDPEERHQIWALLKEYVAERKEYLGVQKIPRKVKELTDALLYGNEDHFEYVINKYYISEEDVGDYDNYIVFTHYHLFVACLYAIASKRKSRLFICKSYTPFNNNTIYKIRKTGIFDSVESFSYGSTVGDLFDEIKKRPGEESVIIPNYLYPKFRNIFRNCNYQEDNMYIFSDTHPYWYFIEREFKHIIKLEDAYNSFDREVKTHQMQGIWSGIQKYEGLYYPEMYFKSDKIEKIIISNESEAIPEYYRSKIEIKDTKELAQLYHDKIKNALLYIYDVDASLFSRETVLVLTQPLALFGYCTKEEQRRLYKRICDQNKGAKILVKPHPADQMKYKYLGVPVLPKNVPTEVYNYLDITIKKVVTFGSSAIETIEFANEKEVLFKMHDFSFDDVVAAIKQLTRESAFKKVGRRIKGARKNG